MSPEKPSDIRSEMALGKRAKIEKQRTFSDAELLKMGAEYAIEADGSARLEPTERQVEITRVQMENIKGRFLIDTKSLPRGLVNKHDGSLGTIEWSKEKFKDALYFPEQVVSLEGSVFLRHLREGGIPVLNGSVLDYLLEHQDQIPEEWKGKEVFFWGTVYDDIDSNESVRYLYWDNSTWSLGIAYLQNKFDWGSHPAAVLPEGYKNMEEK